MTSFKPDLLREDAAQLFPDLPWISLNRVPPLVPDPTILPKMSEAAPSDETMAPKEPTPRRSKRQSRLTNRGPVIG